jgi:hypothetical protein
VSGHLAVRDFTRGKPTSKGRYVDSEEFRGFQNTEQQGFPILKDEHPDDISQALPQMPFAPKVLSALLIQAVCQLKDLMYEERQEIQEKKVHGQMPRAMAIFVFDVVALILQRVEHPIVYLPPASPTSYYFYHRVFMKGDIRYPTVVIGVLACGIVQPVLNIIHPHGLAIAIEGHCIDPFIHMASPLKVFVLQPGNLPQVPLLIDPFHEDPVILCLGHHKVPHPQTLQVLNKGLLAV